MKLKDLNPVGQIGAHSQLVEIGSFRLLIDAGLNPELTGMEAIPNFSSIKPGSLDFIILSHCHLDHLGSLPVIARNQRQAKILLSLPSMALATRMLKNSFNVMQHQKEELNIEEYPLYTRKQINGLQKQFLPMTYEQPRRFKRGDDELEITFFRAGHVAGAAGFLLRHKDETVFFTGDVLFTPQKTLPGARFPVNKIDTLVMETTRGTHSRPGDQERIDEVSRLLQSTKQVLEDGGSVLIPTFALGRMQEILAIVHEAQNKKVLPKCQIFCSGLGLDLVNYFDEIARTTGLVHFRRKILKDLQVQELAKTFKPGKDVSQKGLYILSSGMLVERTPAYMVAASLVNHPKNAIFFVGYCAVDTPGGMLLGAKKEDQFVFEALEHETTVRAHVERFDLSGHADREELLDYALAVDPSTIILTHGSNDARAWFLKALKEARPNTTVIDPEPLKEYTI